jgi:TetR/AcrR family transcriptional regulator
VIFGGELMTTKFFNLDIEKQNRIINSAIKVFAQKGYQTASTNEIVKEAEISKGLLFHYFTNKKELYLFLYDHLIGILSEKIFEKVDWDEKEIFSKYRQVALIKLELFQQYPSMFDFIKAVYVEDAEEVKPDLERRLQEMVSSSYQKLFTEIDYSPFKEEVDIPRAINIIFWTMENFANQYQNKATILHLDEATIKKVIEEMDLYIETLKIAFYK